MALGVVSLLWRAVIMLPFAITISTAADVKDGDLSAWTAPNITRWN
jgi:hypothetical protein